MSRNKRVGELKQATIALIDSLTTEIEKKEKTLEALKVERAMLQKKLAEEE